MKFGIMFANTGTYVDGEAAATLARAAEEAGFESLWTVEHVVVPSGYESPYPYSKDGRMPGPEDMPIPDPFIWLSYVAAATSTINLATGITILPQRNPLIIGKAIATLDRLSGGRVRLGVGAGWLKEEFDAIGVPFEERGDRLDETIRALRVLWSEPKPTFHGRFFDFTDCISEPKPVNGSVPITIGGDSARAARRAGELGDGYFPGSGSPEVIEKLVTRARKVAADNGRDGGAIEITAGGMPNDDTIARLTDIGVSRMVVPVPTYDPGAARDVLAKFGDEVIAKHG